MCAKQTSSVRDLVAKMSSTPRFDPLSVSSSSRSRKRKSTKPNFMIEFFVYHYPGHDPLKRSYQMKKDLHVAHQFSLSLNEECNDKYVVAEISKIMKEEFREIVETSLGGMYTYYRKVGRSNELQKFVYGSLHRFDGCGLKSMTTKDCKKIHVILNRDLPGINGGKNTRRVEKMITSCTSHGEDDEDEEEVSFAISKHTKEAKGTNCIIFDSGDESDVPEVLVRNIFKSFLRFIYNS